MASPIGVSVGDFIAVIQLFKDIANALDEHSGAQAHYQHTVRNLETTQALLVRLESFDSTSGQTTQINAIRAQAKAIHNEVQAFTQKVQKFRSKLGSGASTGKRHGVIDKLKWSRKQAKEAAKLNTSVDGQLRNIQVLLDLDLSERSDIALEHHRHAARHFSALPTRQDFLSFTSQTVDETRAAERSFDSRVDRVEAALLRRIDILEQNTRQTQDDVAKTHDLQDLRTYIDDRLSSTRSGVDAPTSARLVLTLTIPQLQLSKEDMMLLFARLSDELEVILHGISIWIGSLLVSLALVVPQLVLIQRTLRRLPAAVSLVLHDNMTFEDALGRLHSLQYQQFRHWKVFESSLHCIFSETPGMQKVLNGHFILRPEKQPAIALTAANYSALVRPGYTFKMSIAMQKLTADPLRCPKGCGGITENVSVFEYRCKTCKFQYSTGVLDSSGSENGAPRYSTAISQTQLRGPDTNANKFRNRRGFAKNAPAERHSTHDQTPRLDPSNSALILWRPQPFVPHILIDRWERAREMAELKIFKRVHMQMSLPDANGYFMKFFEIEKELGRGHSGIVFLVKHVLDNVTLGHFACKRVPVGSDQNFVAENLVKARFVVELMNQFPHRNLTKYHHAWLEDFKPSSFGPSVPCMFILQQYCNSGSLHDYVYRPARAGHRLVFEEIYTIFRDITAGVRHLHRHGYIHRNLRPSNCLVHTDSGEVRALVSNLWEVQYDSPEQKPHEASGTISYYAPECLHQDPLREPFNNFTAKTDIFSLGLILYFLCFTHLPYALANLVDEDDEDLDQLRDEILSWPGFDDTKRLRSDLPSQLYSLLKRMLSVDPDLRPTADDIHRVIESGWPILMKRYHGH